MSPGREDLGAAAATPGRRSQERRLRANVQACHRSSGRATRQRPRPDTGGVISNAQPNYRDADLEGFAHWFADWWLRRGAELTDPTQRREQ